MIRADFFRLLVLSPLAALVGCKKPEGPRVRTTDGETVVSVPNTWTCDTTSSGHITIRCNDTSSANVRWLVYQTDSSGAITFAGNHLP